MSVIVNGATAAPTSLRPGDWIIREGIAQQVDSVEYLPVTEEVLLRTVSHGPYVSTTLHHKISAHHVVRPLKISEA